MDKNNNKTPKRTIYIDLTLGERAPKRPTKRVIIDMDDQSPVRRTLFQNDDNELERCAICLEEVERDLNLRALNPCGHIFHKQCIIPIARKQKVNRKCPFVELFF